VEESPGGFFGCGSVVVLFGMLLCVYCGAVVGGSG